MECVCVCACSHRALDLWLSYVHHNERLLCRHYAPDGLLPCLATPKWRPLLMELTTTLQPLAQLPLCLDYRLEICLVRERHEAQLSQYMVDKHVAGAQLAHVEGQQLLAHQHLVTKQHPMAVSESSVQLLQATGKQLYNMLQRRTLSVAERLMAGSSGSLTSSTKASAALSPTAMQTHIPAQMRSSAASDRSDVSSNSSGAPCLFHGSPASSDAGSSISGPPSMFHASPASSVESSASVSHCMEAGRHPAQPVIKDNQVLGADLEDSVNAVVQDGLLQRVSKQFKDIASPEKVYKSGITEYKFDAEAANKMYSQKANVSQVKGSQSPSEAVKDLTKHRDIFDADGVPTKAMEGSIEFQIPSRGSIAASRSSSECSSLAHAVQAPGAVTASTNSSSSLRSSGSASSLIAKGGTAIMKRWSSFGPTLISVFDKLLLDESKGTQNSGAPIRPTGTEAAPSSPQEGKSQGGILRAISMDTGLKTAARASHMEDVPTSTVGTAATTATVEYR